MSYSIAGYYINNIESFTEISNEKVNDYKNPCPKNHPKLKEWNNSGQMWCYEKENEGKGIGKVCNMSKSGITPPPGKKWGTNQPDCVLNAESLEDKELAERQRFLEEEQAAEERQRFLEEEQAAEERQRFLEEEAAAEKKAAEERQRILEEEQAAEERAAAEERKRILEEEQAAEDKAFQEKKEKEKLRKLMELETQAQIELLKKKEEKILLENKNKNKIVLWLEKLSLVEKTILYDFSIETGFSLHGKPEGNLLFESITRFITYSSLPLNSHG